MQQQQQRQESSVPHDQLLEAIRALVPELSHDSYKGQSGKVGVVGGCQEYTGAPFFAAMSAMRMGVDLAYVFCTQSAATVIKSYSPELIVMPMLPEVQQYLANETAKEYIRGADTQQAYQSKCQEFIDRLSVLIIGPGLGDDPEVLATVADTIRQARQRGLPLIIDGSGLNLIAQQPDLVKGYSNCILTPNIAEFGRLAKGSGVELEGSMGTHWQKHAQQLAAALGGPLLLSKGQVDVITDGSTSLVVTADGSPRRCGGQGDILTGTIATFIAWQKAAGRHQQQQQQQQQGSTAAAAAAEPVPPLMLAAYAGCITMRAAAVLTYPKRGRSMVAGDMIEVLGDPVLQHCGLLPPGAAGTATVLQPATKL